MVGRPGPVTTVSLVAERCQVARDARVALDSCSTQRREVVTEQ